MKDVVFGVLIPVAILGLLVVGAAYLFRRGADGVDVAPRSLLRLYVYIGSLAGIVVLVVGLSGLLNAGFAAAFGEGFVYGAPPSPFFERPCPVGEPNVKCPSNEQFAQQQARERERRRSEDLLRGITFTVFGALFWGAHRVARQTVFGADPGAPGLHRGYLMVGTIVFGLATIVLLPMGIYQALAYLILPAGDGVYRQGAGESLSGGLVTLPIWLIYLWLVVGDARRTPAATA